MTPEEISRYQRQRIKVLEERHDRTAATLSGYERLLERLTRERDQARAERDAANVQAARLAERRQRDQEWMERWQGAAADEGLKRWAAETTLAEVERVTRRLAAKASISMYDRITLESVATMARETRERGATVDAAGSNPAGGSPTVGSSPTAPTDPPHRRTWGPGDLFVTKTGRVLTGADIERLAEKAREGHSAPQPAEKTLKALTLAPEVTRAVEAAVRRTIDQLIRELRAR